MSRTKKLKCKKNRKEHEQHEINRDILGDVFQKSNLSHCQPNRI